MEAKELRIGNYVKIPNLIKPIQVSIIDTTQNSTKTQAQPIPLTEEWLFKFGYSNENRPNHFQKDEFTIDAHILWDCNGIYIDDKNGVRLKYVHQLKNLYFALKSRELTIK